MSNINDLHKLNQPPQEYKDVLSNDPELNSIYQALKLLNFLSDAHLTFADVLFVPKIGSVIE